MYTVNQFDLVRILKEFQESKLIYRSFIQTKEIMFTIIL